MFAPPTIIQTEVFARLPDRLHCSRPSAWVAAPTSVPPAPTSRPEDFPQ